MLLWRAAGNDFTNLSDEKGHNFSFQNMHIHIHLHLESKPQNTESEMQNKTKPWTTMRSPFLPASYSRQFLAGAWCGSMYLFALFSRSLLFKFHLCTALLCRLCSHQLPPVMIIYHHFQRAPFVTSPHSIRWSAFLSLNIFPSFLIQLISMLIFQKSIYSNVLISSVLTHYAVTQMLVFWTGK